MSAAVCLLPTAARTVSFAVWGFIDILVTPASLRTSSFSSVMVSGLPASTLYSPSVGAPKHSAIAPVSILSSSALSTVGVPPPIYTVCISSPRSFAIPTVTTSVSLPDPARRTKNCSRLSPLAIRNCPSSGAISRTTTMSFAVSRGQISSFMSAAWSRPRLTIVPKQLSARI